LAFLVVVASVWNEPSRHVKSAPSLQYFCSRLMTHLFSRSFLDFLYCLWSDLRHYCKL